MTKATKLRLRKLVDTDEAMNKFIVDYNIPPNAQPRKDTQEAPQPDAPPPPPRPLTIQTRSSSTKSQPQSNRPEPPTPSQPARSPRPEGADSKRKRSPKGKDTADEGKSQPSKEKDEAPRTKQLKLGPQSKGKGPAVQTPQGKGKGIDSQSLPSAWLPAPMLHGGPLLETASLRDLGDGEGEYVADALGRTILLPNDMDELKRMRMQEVFLSTKRYLCMALQATYRMEEEVHDRSKAAENERKKRITASKTLETSEKELAKVKDDLIMTTRERDNVSAGLNSAQKQVWEEALKRAGVDASSDLWKAESVFYSAAIRDTTSTSSVTTDAQPEEEVTPSGNLQASGSTSKAPKEGILQDVVVISQHADPEIPTEITEPKVGVQVSSTEELAAPAQLPQAIPLAVVTQGTSVGPVQSSLEETVIPGIEADLNPTSKNATDKQAEK
ncbi:eukaryotic translation initiation factor 5B-like [Quercus lobata]|uniref:eukaryotic translation initiation factor 5B-like n=1 Tax=Quercus lobata TaxID=97700 RepID=UPI001248B793|nr:eukaryotic translation initiation factor 5B-like [Quercus lobata]